MGSKDKFCTTTQTKRVVKIPFSLNNYFRIPFVNQVASSLNSAYCYILHSGSTVFTWSGGLATSDDQELVDRMLDLIKVRYVLKYV